MTDARGQTAGSQVKLTDVLSPPSLSVQGAVRPSNCTSADGQITVSGSGGVPPYKYSMDGTIYSSNNTFTNLTGGTYIFFVQDANGCIARTGYGFLGDLLHKIIVDFFVMGRVDLRPVRMTDTWISWLKTAHLLIYIPLMV